MIIQTSRKELFYNWLLYLDPLLNLSVIQRKVLSALLTLHYYHRHRYSDVNALNETLFMEDNLQGVQKKLNIPKKSFDKALEVLFKKGILERVKDPEGKETKNISAYLTQYPRDSKFKLTFEFKIID